MKHHHYYFSKLILVGLLMVAAMPLWGQQDLVSKQWRGQWITVPGADPHGYGVYLFRKTIDVKKVTDDMTVYVSGDNRYKLYVNGQQVSAGPDRGDVTHWNYDEVNLAPYLKEGKNVLAAKIWNEGEWMATANHSHETGFILQGVSTPMKNVFTDKSWLCCRDESIEALPMTYMTPTSYTGPGETVDMRKAQTGWRLDGFDDSKWKKAKTLSRGQTRNKVGYGGPYGWQLQPSILPAMEMTEEHTLKVRQSSLGKSFTVPAKTDARILLDNGVMTNAYLTLLMSGGKDATVNITYCESLLEKEYPYKNDRRQVEGKFAWGRRDSLISSGANGQEFTSMNYRNYRYIELRVHTASEPLTINDVYGTFTGYPFTLKAKLDTDNKELQQMMEIGWRTARLCAVDTYFDCPYFEQLQYVGDTRIQAIISMYMTGDDTLFRNALNLFDQSRQPGGEMMSRYPSHIPQYITPYNLYYIAMLHDYMMYATDMEFIRKKLNGAREVMAYFENYQTKDGSVVNLPWWTFTDWVDGKTTWGMGIRKTDDSGRCALIDLQLLYAYQKMASLEENIGIKEMAAYYQQKAEQLKQTVRRRYWDDAKGLFADTEDKDDFSQHAQALAILCGVTTGDEAQNIAEKMLTDETLAQASIYYKFYTHQALVKAGLGDDYLNWLGAWREYMKRGLTTWGEDSKFDVARSDCHAWGASPNIEFFRVILGIDSDAPRFAKVRIEPHLGTLKKIGGEMPHPKGIIKVSYDKQATIVLPDGVTGTFVWKGKETMLKSGENKIKL